MQKRIDSSDQDENASYEEIDDNDLRSLDSDPVVQQFKASQNVSKHLAQVDDKGEDEEQYSEIDDVVQPEAAAMPTRPPEQEQSPPKKTSSEDDYSEDREHQPAAAMDEAEADEEYAEDQFEKPTDTNPTD